MLCYELHTTLYGTVLDYTTLCHTSHRYTKRPYHAHNIDSTLLCILRVAALRYSTAPSVSSKSWLFHAVLPSLLPSFNVSWPILL